MTDCQYLVGSLWFWASIALIVYSESKNPTTWEDIVNRFRFYGYALAGLALLAAPVAVLLAPLAVLHFLVKA